MIFLRLDHQKRNKEIGHLKCEPEVVTCEYYRESAKDIMTCEYHTDEQPKLQELQSASWVWQKCLKF